MANENTRIESLEHRECLSIFLRYAKMFSNYTNLHFS